MYTLHTSYITLNNPDHIHIYILYTHLLCVGIVINYLTYHVIQVTSSLTMKILGGVRNIFTILASILYYHELVDSREGVGYTIAFIGFLLYTAAKSGYFEQQSQQQKQSSQSGGMPGNLNKHQNQVSGMPLTSLTDISSILNSGGSSRGKGEQDGKIKYTYVFVSYML